MEVPSSTKIAQTQPFTKAKTKSRQIPGACTCFCVYKGKVQCNTVYSSHTSCMPVVEDQSLVTGLQSQLRSSSQCSSGVNTAGKQYRMSTIEPAWLLPQDQFNCSFSWVSLSSSHTKGMLTCRDSNMWCRKSSRNKGLQGGEDSG